MSTETVKLPKNFAANVLDLELLIDSGNFDLDTINELMQYYSVSQMINLIFHLYFLWIHIGFLLVPMGSYWVPMDYCGFQ